MKIVAYVPDLMDRSKFVSLPASVDVTFVSNPDGLRASGADMVVGDLGRPGVIEAMSQVGEPKVGFISHIDDESRNGAISAGVRVFARSAFFSRLVTILTNSGTAPADTSD